MNQRIAIFGAGGHGRELLQLIEDINLRSPAWLCEGFLVDAELGSATTQAGRPILGGIEWLEANPDAWVVVAVGPSAARLQVTSRIRQRCANRFATLVHPLAWVGARVRIGAGSVVCAGALVTTDVEIGEHVHVNIGCTIAHDAVLEDYASLYSSVKVSGGVRIGEGAEMGAGSVVIPRRNVGRWSIVGAGAVVTRDVPDNATAVGVPTRVVKQREPGWQRA